jgi:hypothetical protein
VLHARPLADEQLGHAVVEGAAVQLLGRAVLLHQRERRFVLDHHQRVGEGRARAGAPVEGADRHLDLDAARHVEERARADQGGVQRQEPVLVERRGRDHEARLDQLGVLAQRGRQVGEQHALLGEVGRQPRLADLPAVGHRDQAARLQLGAGARAAARLGLAVAGGELLGSGGLGAAADDPRPVEPGGPRVGEAPGLLAAVRPLQLLERGQGLQPPRAEPLRVAERLRPGGHGRLVEALEWDVVDRRHAYPTAPSICSETRRFSSSAYSIGSSLEIGSMKPRTIIAVASASDSPRDWR